MSYRIRFIVGCLQSTPRRSQLWLIGTTFPRSILFVLDDILTIVLIHCLCRWRPETHSFHLPCGEMTVTFEDTQKFLGASVRGRPVIGHCRSDGWRDKVEAFLGRPLPPEAMGYRTTGVYIPGSGRTLLSVRPMQTRRQLPTTARLGSCTCLGVFSSLMRRGTPRHGCTSPASLTRTPQGVTAELPVCWSSYTATSVRCVVEVRRVLP
jgi:hypothetical protein